jgi:hypothetical protein
MHAYQTERYRTCLARFSSDSLWTFHLSWQGYRSSRGVRVRVRIKRRPPPLPTTPVVGDRHCSVVTRDTSKSKSDKRDQEISFFAFHLVPFFVPSPVLQDLALGADIYQLEPIHQSHFRIEGTQLYAFCTIYIRIQTEEDNERNQKERERE